MISHFVKIMDDLKLFHQKTTKNRLIIRSFLGGKCQNMIQNYGGLIGPKMSKFWNSRKLRYPKSIFSMMFPDFSCIFSSISMINTGSEGPLRVPKIRNFGSSQNHPKSIAI